MEMIQLSFEDKPENYTISLADSMPALSSWLPHDAIERKMVILIDETVANIHLAEYQQVFASFQPVIIPVQSGEQAKCLAEVNRIITELLQHNIDRQALLLCIGGGVVTDLGGFIASIYKRGIDVIHLPTTLIGQIDAAIGGKTAVNHELGKNLIGSFYQPKAVLIDTSKLLTLDDADFRAGLAEVVKMGLIADSKLFEFCETHRQQLLRRDPQTLRAVIKRCCEIKAEFVSADQRDHGIRALLNFGHTVGHAIESVLSPGKIRHGEAVSIGMVIAARLSHHFQTLEIEQLSRIEKLLANFKLPIRMPAAISITKILRTVANDKKNLANKLRFILLKDIGQAYIYDNVVDSLLYDVMIAENNTE